MEWTPITSEELNQLIKDSEAQLSDAGKKLWDSIKVVPHKWQQPWGEEGGGFWVVAVFYNRVIYYNDIEEGFNISTFKEDGTIAEYVCDDKELHEIIYSFTEINAENDLPDCDS